MRLERPVVLFVLSLALEAGAEDFTGTRPLGMGGAHRAIVTGNDAILLNPAGMSLLRHYSFEAQYLVQPSFQTEDGPAEHVFHASVVDNQIAPFATGLAYTRIERSDNKKGNRYDLAFSMNLSDNLLVGADFKYLNFDRDGKANAIDAVTCDLGLLLRFDFGLNLAVAGYNLTNTADYLEHPVSMAVGAMFSPFRSLEVAFDWFINFQKPLDPAKPIEARETGYSYHVGVEYMLFNQLVLRAGYANDQADPFGDQQYWCLGAGYISEMLAIDFGYQGSFSDSFRNTIGVMLRLFVG